MVAERVSEPMRTSIRLPDTICHQVLTALNILEGDYEGSGRVVITPDEIIAWTGYACLRIPVKQQSPHRYHYEVVKGYEWREVMQRPKVPNLLAYVGRVIKETTITDSAEQQRVAAEWRKAAMARPPAYTFPVLGYDADATDGDMQSRFSVAERILQSEAPLACIVTGDNLTRLLRPIIKFGVASRRHYEMYEFTLKLEDGAMSLMTGGVEAGDFTWWTDISRRGDGLLFRVVFARNKNNDLFKLLLTLFGTTGARVTLDTENHTIRFSYGRLCLLWSVLVGGNDARATA